MALSQILIFLFLSPLEQRRKEEARFACFFKRLDSLLFETGCVLVLGVHV